MAATPWPDPDAPYEPATPDQWLSEVASWPWTSLGSDRWKLAGNCPRCGHPMEKILEPQLVQFAIGPGKNQDPEWNEPLVECNCDSTHPGRPESAHGCGARGVMPGPHGSGTPRPPELAEVEWERKRAELVADALPRIHSSAEKWGATIGVLTGVFGAAGFIKGREEISKLETWVQWVIGLGLGLAVALAVTGIVTAALAAQGTTVTIRGTQDFWTSYANATENAASYLKASRWLVVSALIPLAIAVGFELFGPAKTSPGTAVLAVPKAGAITCGELATDAAGALVLRPVGNGKEELPLTDVEDVTVIDSCP